MANTTSTTCVCEKKLHFSQKLFPWLQIAHGHTHTLSNVLYVRRANLARDRTQV